MPRYPKIDVDRRQKLFIDGDWVEAQSGESFETLCPATGEVLATLARAREDDVAAAVAAARRAYRTGWDATEPEERATLLNRLAERLAGQADRLSLIEVVENGSTIRRMRHDIDAGIRLMRYYAGLVREIQGRTVPLGRDTLTYTVRQPYGVVASIAPFNHPFMFAAQFIGVALAAGNTIVLKPSGLTSLTALEIARASEGILPPGVLNVLTGSGEECGAPLVRHPDVRRVHFKGSVPTGRKVMEMCSAEVKPVTLELGGKNPFIVYPDADLKTVVAGAVKGMNLAHQGQSCGSATRIFVHEEIYDDFRDALIQAFRQIHVGIPWEMESDMGAIVSRAQFDKINSYIEAALKEGARLLTGGRPAQGEALRDGLYIEPTIFEDVTAEMRIAQDEVFGPVTCLFRWQDEDELFEAANDIPYGLTASVWTRDLATAHRAAAKLEAGYVWINGHGPKPTGVPSGGFKQSGLGRERGLEELLSYTQEKSVIVSLKAM